MTLGDRIKAARSRAGISSQRELADLTGLSVDLVRKLEQGQRLSASLPTLTRLAAALNAPLTDLLGVEPGLGPDRRDDVEALRQAIYDPTTGDPGTRTATAVDVDSLWGMYWNGRYTALTRTLPGVLTTARAATSRADHATLAELLQLAGSLAAHLQHEDLAQVALLQAVTAAEIADDALLRAAQQVTRAWVLSRQGLWVQAERLASRVAAEVTPAGPDDTPEHIAVWGELHHFATLALARDGRTSEARDLAEVVTAAGEALGSRRSRGGKGRLFSSAFAAHSAMATAAALDQPRETLALADRVDGPGLPPTVWARYMLNLAWALTAEWRSREALETLRRVDQRTPELLRRHGLARAVVEELLPRRAGGERLPGLVSLAEKIGKKREP